MNESPPQKKFRWFFSVVIAAFVLLGLRVVSDDDLRERLGSTYTFLVLMTAGVALVLLTMQIHDRLFRR